MLNFVWFRWKTTAKTNLSVGKLLWQVYFQTSPEMSHKERSVVMNSVNSGYCSKNVWVNRWILDRAFPKCRVVRNLRGGMDVVRAAMMRCGTERRPVCKDGTVPVLSKKVATAAR